MDRFRRVEEAFLGACRASGYREVRTPTIEYLHLFTAAGTLSPEMLHRVFSFLDWDGWTGERVVLRPEATIPTARLYAEHLGDERPARLCYVQNIFRFAEGDEPREDWQCGVELIGESGIRCDLELILLGLSVLEAVGFPDAEVRLSHAGLVRAVLARTGLTPEEQAASYDRMLDGDRGVIAEIEERLPELDAPLHLLFDVPGSGTGYLANVRQALLKSLPELGAPLDQLEATVGALEAVGHSCRVQAVLARSFEYYSGTLFRFFLGDAPVGGGGRYDELLGLVGGEPVPASGFALEVSALAQRLAAGASSGGGVVVVRPADDSQPALVAALRAARGLRERGIACRLALGREEPAMREVEAHGEGGPLVVRTDAGQREVEGIVQAASLLGGRS
jgi:histidyl-tRNA synthetase